MVNRKLYFRIENLALWTAVVVLGGVLLWSTFIVQDDKLLQCEEDVSFLQSQIDSLTGAVEGEK